MNKLYANAFKKILGKLLVQEITRANVEATLQENKIKPIGPILFHMMARQQMDTFLKIPCPVQNTQSDDNKAIINSAKNLRVNFSINEKRVCSKCPHRETCPFFAREGRQNTTNAFPDLLLYMQAINNQVDTLQPTKVRFFQSAYKVCNQIPSLIDDLKLETPEIMQYQKARAQYANIQTKPAPSPAGQKPVTEREPHQPQGKKKFKARQSKQEYQDQQEQEQEVSEFVEKKTRRRDQDIENRRRRQKQNYRPSQKYQRSRQYFDSRPRRFSLDDSYTPPPKQRQQGSTRILNYSDQPNRYENRRPSYERRNQSQPREPRQSRNNYQQRRQKKDKGYEDKVMTRSKQLYNERKNHGRSLERVKEQEFNFEQRFERAGKTLRDAKVMQSWDQGEEDRFGNSARPRRERKPSYEQAPPQQRVKTESQYFERKEAEAGQKRGRRLRK